jgi:hypothetical protein
MIERPAMYTHVVFFLLHDPADATEFSERLMAMKGQVPTLTEIEVGIDDAPSGRSAHLSLITRFEDAAGLQAYSVHPVHQAFLQWARPRIERTMKVDYAG